MRLYMPCPFLHRSQHTTDIIKHLAFKKKNQTQYIVETLSYQFPDILWCGWTLIAINSVLIGHLGYFRSFTITSSAIITHTCHFCFCANTFSGKILRVGLMSQVVNMLVTFTENASLPLRGVYHCLFLLAVSEGTCFNSASPIEGILDMCKSKT